MSGLLPVPPHDEPDRSFARKGFGDAFRPPRPWTDESTGTKHAVIFDPSDGHYQVGLTASTTLRVSARAYAEYGKGSFECVRQAQLHGDAYGRRRVGSYLYGSDRTRVGIVTCDERSSVWTLETWE